jgi:cation:H+ antiporter
MTVGTILMLLAGLAALGGGGDVLVRGASGLAKALGIPPLVVGLTVVSFATSAPELAVTLQAAVEGNPGIAIGNVVGSNIANILLILGICAVLLPLAVRVQMIRIDIPVMVVFAVATLLLALDGSISRLDGGLLVLALVGYTAVTVVVARRRQEQQVAPARVGAAPASPWVALGLVALGVALLVVGARLLVGGATEIASAFGVSDLVIGLTVVSVGTSLPELAASLVAAARGERDLAVGNVVGSCLFNVGAVLGITGLVVSGGVPVAPAAVRLDIPIMIAASLVLIPVAFTGLAIARWEGGLFVAYYAAYVVYVLLAAAEHDAVTPFSGVMLSFVIPITALWLALLVAYEIGLRRGRRRASPPT